MDVKINEIDDGKERIGDIGNVWAVLTDTGWMVMRFPVFPDGGMMESGLTKAEAEAKIKELL